MMATLIKANGKMIRNMDKDTYSIKMAKYIKETLKMMLKKVKVCKLGQTEHNILDIGKMTNFPGKESIVGQMDAIIMVTGQIIK